MCDSENDRMIRIWGWRGATSTFSQRMKRLLETVERSDIQFVLSAGSDVFDTMFHGKRLQLLIPQVNEKTIKLPDILPQAFGIMLKYLYTDVIEDLDVENVLPTMYCATKYGLPLLVDFCTEYTIKNVDKSTCLPILEAAKFLDAEKVVNKCLEILDTHFSDILESEELSGVKNETLRFLFSRDSLVLKEAEVYSAAERWALKACHTHHLEPTAANRRLMLGEVLFLIRFPLMDDGQLANGPGKTGLLLKEELLDIYQFKRAIIKPTIPFSGSWRSRLHVTFCGHKWIILDDHRSGMITRSNAFLDDRGHLHLRLSEHSGVWKGAGIQSAKALPSGNYDFEVGGVVDLTKSSMKLELYSQDVDETEECFAPLKLTSYYSFIMEFKIDHEARVSIILSRHFCNAPSAGKETEIILHSLRLLF